MKLIILLFIGMLAYPYVDDFVQAAIKQQNEREYAMVQMDGVSLLTKYNSECKGTEQNEFYAYVENTHHKKFYKTDFMGVNRYSVLLELHAISESEKAPEENGCTEFFQKYSKAYILK